MARAQKPKELFTASEVARFCQVDLKTIHNWSERGEIRHFRTPGRHLRFRRADVLDFLRKYGYPIPDVLSEGRPRVVALTDDGGAASGVKKALAKQFDVSISEDALGTLVAMGAETPDVLVVDSKVGGIDAVSIMAALKQHDATRNVRTVLYAQESEAHARKALDGGASACVEKGDVAALRETLESLLGLTR